jgi:serine/threonine-protein kinase
MPEVPPLEYPLRRRLEHLWQLGQRPDVHEFLASARVSDPAVLAEVLAVDQWRRWHAGERVPAEDYLRRYPALADNPETVLELVYGEWLVREEVGEQPVLDEYLERFPRWADRLRHQLDLHQALAAESTWRPSSAGAEAGEQTWPSQAGHADGPRSPGGKLPVLPGYEILGELGRGAMGVVYRARQLRLNRTVALKMVLAGDHAGPAALVRFLREAELAASLQHPNIVQIHEIGAHGSLPYFTLEYVEGGTLAAHLAGKALPAASAAALLEQLAGAIDHAHRQGVLHRDLKPGNILLQKSGVRSQESGVRAERNPAGLPDSCFLTPDSCPKITDFGLARRVEGGSGLTQTGAILGTPSYMAPEQAAGRGDVVGPAADIWALGAILYECLAGRPPFLAETPYETLAQVLSLDPVAPSRLQPRCPRDLETICLKCLRKHPAERYASAGDLADDLRRFRAGQPIRARRVGRLERAAKWARRKPALATLWATGVVGALLATGLWLWTMQARARQRREVTTAVGKAVAEAQQLRHDWGKALAQARRAEALLEGADVDPELRRRVQTMLAELRAEERDRQMVEALERVRLLRLDPRSARFDFATANRDYEKAFRDFGVDVPRVDPREAAQRLGARPIRGTLAAALEDWASVRRLMGDRDAQGRERLLKVALDTDPAPWRARLHQALAEPGAGDLKKFAAGRDMASVPARTVVLLAEALADRDDWATAIAVLRRAWLRHSGDFWVNYTLAIHHSRLQRPDVDEILRHMATAYALRPRSAFALVALGYALEKKGRLEEGIACYRRALELEKDYAVAHFSLGNALQAKGQHRLALACQEEAVRLRPDFADAHNALGNALRKLGRPAEAARAYRKAIDLDRHAPEPHNGLGVALSDLGKVDEAIAAYREALRRQKDFAPALSNLAIALRDKGLPDQAIKAARAALAQDGKRVEAHTALGNALLDKGRLDEAVAAYQEALRLDPGYADAHNGLGGVLVRKGRLDEAISAFRTAVSFREAYAAAHLNLGEILRQQGRLPEALAAYRKAVRYGPHQPEAHNGLGVALQQTGQLDEALKHYREAIRLRPGYAVAFNNLGNALREKGRSKEAVVAFREAMRLGMDDAVARYNLALALEQLGRLEEAAASYRGALARREDHAEAHCNLGLLLQRLGRLPEALKHLQRGHALGSARPDWNYPSARWVESCARRLRAEEGKLPRSPGDK